MAFEEKNRNARCHSNATSVQRCLQFAPKNPVGVDGSNPRFFGKEAKTQGMRERGLEPPRLATLNPKSTTMMLRRRVIDTAVTRCALGIPLRSQLTPLQCCCRPVSLKCAMLPPFCPHARACRATDAWQVHVIDGLPAETSAQGASVVRAKVIRQPRGLAPPL